MSTVIEKFFLNIKEKEHRFMSERRVFESSLWLLRPLVYYLTFFSLVIFSSIKMKIRYLDIW